jgi:hypothetical protein
MHTRTKANKVVSRYKKPSTDWNVNLDMSNIDKLCGDYNNSQIVLLMVDVGCYYKQPGGILVQKLNQPPHQFFISNYVRSVVSLVLGHIEILHLQQKKILCGEPKIKPMWKVTRISTRRMAAELSEAHWGSASTIQSDLTNMSRWLNT